MVTVQAPERLAFVILKTVHTFLDILINSQRDDKTPFRDLKKKQDYQPCLHIQT